MKLWRRGRRLAVAVVVGKELLQVMMLVISAPFQQSLVGALGELGRSRVNVAIET